MDSPRWLTDPLLVHQYGPGVAQVARGRVSASGAGWAWIDSGGRPAHLTGERGPMLPVTLRVERVPPLRPGSFVTLDLSRARPWHANPRPEPAGTSDVRDGCDAVRAHAWNDPRAHRLGIAPLDESLRDLVGRGPGLTPAGDDALLGYLIARDNRAISARIVWAVRGASTAPSLALVRWAARGQPPEVAADMLAALLRADGHAIGPALVRLVALGGTTGRAILTGMLAGLRELPPAG